MFSLTLLDNVTEQPQNLQTKPPTCPFQKFKSSRQFGCVHTDSLFRISGMVAKVKKGYQLQLYWKNSHQSFQQQLASSLILLSKKHLDSAQDTTDKVREYLLLECHLLLLVQFPKYLHFLLKSFAFIFQLSFSWLQRRGIMFQCFYLLCWRGSYSKNHYGHLHALFLFKTPTALHPKQ